MCHDILSFLCKFKLVVMKILIFVPHELCIAKRLHAKLNVCIKFLTPAVASAVQLLWQIEEVHHAPALGLDLFCCLLFYSFMLTNLTYYSLFMLLDHLLFFFNSLQYQLHLLKQ